MLGVRKELLFKPALPLRSSLEREMKIQGLNYNPLIPELNAQRFPSLEGCSCLGVVIELS